MDGTSYIDTSLQNYVRRIANLHDDRDSINGDIREVYGEAKDAGFNVTILRGMVKEHRMDADARNSLYQLQEEYRIKLGMLIGTPLGDAAEARQEATRRHADGMAAAMASETRPKPAKTFAEQTVHDPARPRGRGRPRKSIDRAIDAARSHIGGGPQFDA